MVTDAIVQTKLIKSFLEIWICNPLYVGEALSHCATQPLNYWLQKCISPDYHWWLQNRNSPADLSIGGEETSHSAPAGQRKYWNATTDSSGLRHYNKSSQYASVEQPLIER